jgi:hypothetical protein
LRFEFSKRLTEVLVSNSKECAQLKLTLRSGSELIEDALGERGFDGAVFLDELQTHRGLAGKGESESGSRGGEAVLPSEEQEVASSMQVEIGIAPGVEVGATSERLSWVVGSIFACMVDECDGNSKGAGELAESGENGGDLSGVVFVGALESHVGVEDEKPGLVLLKGKAEPMEIFGSVESESRFEDKPHIEGVEVGLACLGELLEPFPDLFGRILGGVDEDDSRPWDVESSETGLPGGDGDGELQSEPGFSAFGLSADDAHCPFAPELVDEPKGGVVSAGSHARGLNDPQRGAHRCRPVVEV